MSPIVILLLLTPLVFLVPKRYKVWFTLGVVGAGAAVALSAALPCLVGGAFRAGDALQWGYATLFGAEYGVVDRLSAFFMLIICVGTLAVLLYSRGYMAQYVQERPAAHISLHYMALALLFFSMLGVVTCRGGYGFLICWELMTLASFVLILFDAQKPATRRAALSYVVMMHVGFVFLLVGFITLQVKGLPVNFDSLASYFSIYPPLPLLLLFLVGFGLKAGVFPLHTWLPEAHPAAPSHVSALMSGVMIKMGVYGMLRVTSYMSTDLLTAGLILFAVGIVTGVWGVLFAAVQNDIKRLLAYSSIENIGIIFLAMGAALIGRSQHNTVLTLLGMAGALLHTFNHSMFKTLLFFGAGNVYTATHTTSMEALGGLAKRMPVTAAMFLAGAAAICALPPLSGFVSEFLVYAGLLDVLKTGIGGAAMGIAGIVALSFIGGIVMIAFTKLYGVVFLGAARSETARHAAEADGFRTAASCIPLLAILAVGLAPFLLSGTLFDLAGSVAGIEGGRRLAELFVDRDLYMVALMGGIFVLLTLLLYAIKKYALSRRTVTASPTWGCGFGAPSAAMQYTGESFAEGLQSVAPHLSGTVAGGIPGRDEVFPAAGRFSIRRDDRVASLFNAWWVELLRMVNMRVMKMRTGKVNYYLLYALLFLLLILVLSVLGII